MKTNTLNRQRVLIALIGLIIVVTFQVYRQRSAYQLYVFRATSGWGYTIISHGDSLIYQPTIPGFSGQRGFNRPEDARQVGQLMIDKLEKGQFPPTLTRTDLAQLGIRTP